MPAWSLTGSLLLALTAPAAGERGTTPTRAKPSVKVVEARREAYRMPAGAQHVALVTDDAPALTATVRDLRRLSPDAVRPGAHVLDPGAESVRLLLRDRLARRPGALDARVEWRLTGAGSDVGLGGGLARIVSTLLRD